MNNNNNSKISVQYKYQRTHVYKTKTHNKFVLDVNNEAIAKVLAEQPADVKLTTAKCHSGDVCQKVGDTKKTAVLLGTDGKYIYFLLEDGSCEVCQTNCWVSTGETKAIDWHFIFNPVSRLASNPEKIFDDRSEAFTEMTTNPFFKNSDSGDVIVYVKDPINDDEADDEDEDRDADMYIVIGVESYQNVILLRDDEKQLLVNHNSSRGFYRANKTQELEFYNADESKKEGKNEEPVSIEEKSPVELFYLKNNPVGYDIRPEAFEGLSEEAFRKLRTYQRFCRNSTGEILTIVGIDRTSIVNHEVDYICGFQVKPLKKEDLSDLVPLPTSGKLDWQVNGKRKAEDVLEVPVEKSAKV
jgi:hypothetical protein